MILSPADNRERQARINKILRQNQQAGNLGIGSKPSA